MSRATGAWVQFELKLAPGAEAWVIVRHRQGWFKVPLDAAVGELMRGVQEGWSSSRDGLAAASRTLRVRADEWHELREIAAAYRAGSQSPVISRKRAHTA